MVGGVVEGEHYGRGGIRIDFWDATHSVPPLLSDSGKEPGKVWVTPRFLFLGQHFAEFCPCFESLALRSPDEDDLSVYKFLGFTSFLMSLGSGI